MARGLRDHDFNPIHLSEVRRPTRPRWHLKSSNIFLVKLRSLSFSLFTPSSTSSTNTTSPMNPQDSPQALQSSRSRSSSRSRAESIRYHASQYKWLICFLAGMVLIIMAIGLLFVAHQYYLEFGGQGWLKVRDENQEQEVVLADNLFLPLKNQKRWTTDLHHRSPQNDVPFYQCGDQENSCEIYNQPVGDRPWNTLSPIMLTFESRIYAALHGRFVTQGPSLCRGFSAATHPYHNSTVKPQSLGHQNA